MKVYIYDQYSKVLNEDGELLHSSEGSTSTHGEFNNLEDAKNKVNELYEESKALGTYTDKIVKLGEGYAELVIEFVDKKKLNRVIYIGS
jgi:hypothetical protein